MATSIERIDALEAKVTALQVENEKYKGFQQKFKEISSLKVMKTINGRVSLRDDSPK